MRSDEPTILAGTCALVVGLALLLAAPAVQAGEESSELAAEAATEAAASEEAAAKEAEEAKPRMDLYGFVMTDVGYRTGQIDPDWFDVIRPTKMASFEDEFGPDGSTYFSVRQTRFGVKAWLPTKVGEVFTQFEWELFGTGVDAGQTTLRLRHAYGELGQFGAGQYWSPFMDIDVFPNSLEYWGPSGMVFFRNVQVRWMPIKGDTRLTIALERPGASGDQGRFEEWTALEDVKGHFPWPDLSAEYRHAADWGYVEIAGIVRRIEWEDVGADEVDLGAGSAMGWGLNLSSNLKLGKPNTLRLQVVYGEGIQNYMNDATADIGIEIRPNNQAAPIKGVAIPMLGVVAFLDHNWSDEWSTAVGFSTFDMDNTNGQADDAFAAGRYALVNLLHYPAPNVMYGAELQYGYRENFNDGWSVDDFKVQFSFKYTFAHTLGGNS